MTKLIEGGVDRRHTFKLLAATTGTLAVPVFIQNAFAQEKFAFRMAHSKATGSPLTNAFEKWGKVLNERSEGRIDAQHFPASQLGSYSQLIEQSRLGTIEATTGGPDTESRGS